MEGSDLNYYFNWIKTQLSSQVEKLLLFKHYNDFGNFLQEYRCVNKAWFWLSFFKNEILLCHF